MVSHAGAVEYDRASRICSHALTKLFARPIELSPEVKIKLGRARNKDLFRTDRTVYLQQLVPDGLVPYQVIIVVGDNPALRSEIVPGKNKSSRRYPQPLRCLHGLNR